MKRLHLVLIIGTLSNCIGQKKNTFKQNTIMNFFDIETFNKNKNSLKEYNFIKNDTINIKQRENKKYYIEIIKTENDFFEEFYAFYKTGTLKLSVKRFPNSFQKGIMKEFNEDGKLIKEENLDKPYLFTWDHIKQYLAKHEVENLNKQVISIRRFKKREKKEHTGAPYWELDFKGKYNDIKGRFFIELDGITGEELLVKKFKGKGALGEDGTVAVYDTIYINKTDTRKK